MNFIFIFLLVALLFCLIMALICTLKNNKIYCYIYEHKEWKLWETVCKRLPLAKFDGHYIYEETPYLENYKFYIHDIGINKPVIVIYWVKTNVVSVHTDKNCILSDFDKYHSDKAKNIIKGMI